MVGQDLTKLALILVLLGGGLAVAVFRPTILPVSASPGQGAEESGLSPVSPTAQAELDRRRYELDQRQAALDGREAALNQHQAELEEREAGLDQRQATLDEREAELNRRQAQLEGREAELGQRQATLGEREGELNQRQAQLEEREAELSQRRAELDDHEAALGERLASLQATQARLGRREADLAKREQEAEGFRRWSVVALAVSGLLAVPSVLVLVALMRQRQPAHAPQAQRRERVTGHDGLTKATPAPAYGDNGRDRERVAHRV